MQAYDNAINDLAEVALQQEGEPNRIDALMAEAERVRKEPTFFGEQEPAPSRPVPSLIAHGPVLSREKCHGPHILIY